MSVMPMKRCAGCLQELPRSSFNANAKSTDGLYTYCRECAAERKRDWRAKNAEKVRDYERAYRQQHREAFNEKRRGLPVSEKARARVDQWVAANRDRYLETKRRYYQANKAALAPAMRARYERMRDELHDYYVASMLCQGTPLRPYEIPPELIEMKRDQLRVHRLVAGLELAIEGEQT